MPHSVIVHEFFNRAQPRKALLLLEVYRSSGSASADIRMNFDTRILIRIRNISCGCHADIANNKRIIFSYS